MVISQETHDSRVKAVQQSKVHDARSCVSFFKLESFLFEELLVKLTKFHGTRAFRRRTSRDECDWETKQCLFKKRTFCVLHLKDGKNGIIIYKM